MGCGNSKGAITREQYKNEKVKQVNESLYFDVNKDEDKLEVDISKGFSKTVQTGSANATPPMGTSEKTKKINSK